MNTEPKFSQNPDLMRRVEACAAAVLASRWSGWMPHQVSYVLGVAVGTGVLPTHRVKPIIDLITNCDPEYLGQLDAMEADYPDFGSTIRQASYREDI
jgi:hypothetical protein